LGPADEKRLREVKHYMFEYLWVWNDKFEACLDYPNIFLGHCKCMWQLFGTMRRQRGPCPGQKSRRTCFILCKRDSTDQLCSVKNHGLYKHTQPLIKPPWPS